MQRMLNQINVTQATEVTPAWVLKQMEAQGVTVSKIVKDTGCNQTNISGWIHNRRPMSAPTKAMLWFYFKQLP